MKIFAAGVKRQYGTGKTSGNPYDMLNLLSLVPMTSGQMGAMNVNANGFEVMEMRLDSLDTFNQFSTVKFPCVVDIDVEPVPHMGKLVMTVVKFNAVVPAKA
jgi:hypothetical protein